jgi:AcrR family transcriptional regulator
MFKRKVVMAIKKEDRRIQRTRNMLYDAFLDLMIEKGYDALPSQKILGGQNFLF